MSGYLGKPGPQGLEDGNNIPTRDPSCWSPGTGHELGKGTQTTCTGVHTDAHIHGCMHPHAFTHAHTYTYVHTHMPGTVYTSTHTTRAHTCMHPLVCIHHVHIHAHTHVYMYTHILPSPGHRAGLGQIAVDRGLSSGQPVVTAVCGYPTGAMFLAGGQEETLGQ